MRRRTRVALALGVQGGEELTMPSQYHLSDWFSGSDALASLLWAAYVFVVAAAALAGGFVTGFLVQHVGGLLVRNLSLKVVSRARIVGGVLAALLAILLLHPGWLGLGGGGPGEKAALTGETVSPTDTASKQSVESTGKTEPPSLAERPASQGVLRILVLGRRTSPPYEPVDRYFAFPDDAQPKPLTAEEVLQRIEAVGKEGQMREVEMIFVPESTSPGNLPVQRLRSEIEKRGIRLYAPAPMP